MMTKNKLDKDNIQHETTKAQLAVAVKQINNLIQLQLVLVNSLSIASTSVTDTKWPISLDVMATMFKSGNQMHPVTIKWRNTMTKTRCNGTVNPSTLTTRDAR